VVWRRMIASVISKETAKFEWLQDPIQMNDVGVTYQEKKSECVRGKINYLATCSKNNNIRHLYIYIYGGIN
jgi:hypothetical protein